MTSSLSREAMAAAREAVICAVNEFRFMDRFDKFARAELVANVTTAAITAYLSATGWRTIDSAPKDGTEILVYRRDCGVLLARYVAPDEFLHESELAGMDDTDKPDWFCADFVSGSRMANDGEPTHWMPLPAPPSPTGKEE